MLAHGEFEAMIEADLPFGTSTARMLMQIARQPELAKRQHIHVLPPSWGTLYELSKLDSETLTEALAAGAIHPDMERTEAALLRTGERRQERLARAEALAQASVPLASSPVAARRWSVLYADPPWRYTTYSERGRQKAPDQHYPTLTLEGAQGDTGRQARSR